MAAVWRLPVVFFCENNQAEDIPLLPQSTSPEQHPQLCEGLCRAHDVPQVGLSTDIMDVMASDEMGKVLPRAQGYGDALPTDRRRLLRRSTDGSG